jgi:hypothetical protein
MKKFKLITVLLALSILAFNCSKGPVGPQGSTGPQGPVGPAGPIGTANVIYSAWFLTGTGWDSIAHASSYGAKATFDQVASSITQTIIDSGVVLAYMKGDPTTGLANEVFPLPYSVGVGFNFTDLWDFVLNAPGNIRFLYKSDSPWTLAILGRISFRYIIIPGGVAGGRMLNLKKMSYEEVCKLYNIPE